MKRFHVLQPISRDHHHCPLLCWKIRTGFRKNIAIERIKKYADWFFENLIQPHFIIEEKHIFPILGNDNELVKKALSAHKRLSRLFGDADDMEKSLGQIEEELEAHICFEERILFNDIQKIASEEQLNLFSKHHSKIKFQENFEDEFWKKT